MSQDNNFNIERIPYITTTNNLIKIVKRNPESKKIKYLNMTQEDILYCLQYCLRKSKDNIYENIIPCYSGENAQTGAIKYAISYLNEEWN